MGRADGERIMATMMETTRPTKAQMAITIDQAADRKRRLARAHSKARLVDGAVARFGALYPREAADPSILGDRRIAYIHAGHACMAWGNVTRVSISVWDRDGNWVDTTSV